MIIPKWITDEYDVLGSVEDRDHILVLQRRADGSRFILKKCSRENLEVLQSLRRLCPEGVPRIRMIYDSEESGKGTEEDSGDNPEEKGLSIGNEIYVLEDEIDGERLDAFVRARKNTLDEAWVFSFLDKTAAVLETLHHASPPLIHRDIKPENMMIGPDDSVWLLDFNISRLFDHKAASDKTNRDTHVMGTAGYAAPEQYGFMESDARSDIYSLGATVSYILDKTGIESASLRKIVKKCMAFTPKDRYQSAEELRRAARRYEKRLPDAKTAGCRESGQLNHDSDHGILTGYEGGSLYGNRYFKYAPPGFRRGSVSRMILAVLVYALFAYVIMHYYPGSMNSDHVHYHADTILHRAVLTAMLMICILFDCNYCDIWNYMSQIKRAGLLKRFGILLLINIFVFIFAVIIIYFGEQVVLM